MKHIQHTLLLIAACMFLNIAGFGAIQKQRKDSQATQQILEQIDSMQQVLLTVSAELQQKPSALVFPKVVGIGSIVKARPANLAVFNDYIYLRIDSVQAFRALVDSITGGKRDTMGDVILYINGNAMRDLGVMNIDLKKRELIFKLDRHSKFLMKFFPEFPYLWSTIPVSISAGFRNGMILPVDLSVASIKLAYVSKWSIGLSLLFVISIVLTFVVLAARTNLIRIGDNHSPYSLSLTQLAFWSIVVASSYIYIWIVTEELPPITGSTLILLSVSAVTTAGSRLVDIRGRTGGIPDERSDSFIEDILQDELGYSVHRAQMFMWTVIMGIIFVTSVIRLQQIPQLDESLLALMGISSGAYVGLKTMENKKGPETETAAEKQLD